MKTIALIDIEAIENVFNQMITISLGRLLYRQKTRFETPMTASFTIEVTSQRVILIDTAERHARGKETHVFRSSLASAYCLE